MPDLPAWKWNAEGAADLLFLARCVDIAYESFKTWQGGKLSGLPIPQPLPEDKERATAAIKAAYDRSEKEAAKVPGHVSSSLTHINPIFVYEAWPNGRPDAPKLFGLADRFNEYQKGYQLMGFAATQHSALNDAKDTVRNVCVLRGTVTKAEVTASVGGDALSWVAETEVKYTRVEPSKVPPVSIGKTKASFWSWYADGDGYASLASSIQTAVTSVKSITGAAVPWAFTGHSLGGGLITLGALDLMAIPGLAKAPAVVTFGSVMVGDVTFVKGYNARIPDHIRVENACDFVPTLQGFNVNALDLERDPPYIFRPVGKYKRFVLQRYALWGNHNFKRVYLRAMVEPLNFPLTALSIDELD